MHELTAGIDRFQSTVFPSERELFERLARQQAPAALFVTCSDSRISPNLITQTRPGRLFVVRNAGNIIPPYPAAFASGEAASVEFALVVLGVHDIVVCGHSQCAAVGAILNAETAHQLPALQAWLVHSTATRRIVEEKYRHLTAEQRMTAALEAHVLVQLEQLATHPSVSERLKQGELTLHGWVYTIESGEVRAYDSSRRQFLPVTGLRSAVSDNAPDVEARDGVVF